MKIWIRTRKLFNFKKWFFTIERWAKNDIVLHCMIFQKCIDWAWYVLVDQALLGGGMRSTECPSSSNCFYLKHPQALTDEPLKVWRRSVQSSLSEIVTHGLAEVPGIAQGNSMKYVFKYFLHDELRNVGLTVSYELPIFTKHITRSSQNILHITRKKNPGSV